MAPFRMLLVMSAAAFLSACVTSEPASRSALDPAASPAGGMASYGSTPVVMQARYDVVGLSIDVPRNLTVSEANSFHPRADIVWRGDAYGDRHQQVAEMFRAAATAAAAPMHQGQPVNVALQVTRFHSVTDKTRYTVGGVHSMHFMLTVTDAATGQVVDGPRPVVADVRAAGGAQAIAEDRAGRSQKIVVVERLTEVLRRELSARVTDPAVISRALTPVQPTAPETAG